MLSTALLLIIGPDAEIPVAVIHLTHLTLYTLALYDFVYEYEYSTVQQSDSAARASTEQLTPS